MDADSIFTRRRFGIDVNVLVVMLITVLLCIGLVSYKLIGNKKACLPFSISAKGYNNQKNNTYMVNETVMLNASLPANNNMEWDFGDGTPTVSGNSAIHVFLKAGKFTVTATENGQCSQLMDVTINMPLNPHVDPVVYDAIEGNTSPITGETQNYTCKITAKSYEWSVPSSTQIETKRGQSVSYQFPLAQTYELQVKLDNDPSKVYRKTINPTAAVKPDITKPEPVRLLPVTPANNNNQPPKPNTDDYKPNTNPVENNIPKEPTIVKKDPDPITPTQKTKYIPNESFQGMLEDLVNGNGEMDDFLPYLAYGTKTKVWENEKWTTFAELFKHLKNKKIQIKNVVLHREENKNVQNIEIQYKKKGLLDRIL